MNKAAEGELFKQLEKTAANPMNFIKNVTGHNVRKAQKALASGLESEGTRTGIKELRNGVKNAKADRNLARLGTAAGVTAAGAGVGGIKAYQSSQIPGGEQSLNQQYGYYNQPNEQMQQLASQHLLDRLEKTANTTLHNQYPSYTPTHSSFQKTAEENGRQDRDFLTESMLGVGPLAHFAKKNNKLGVNPEDSHTVADAKLGALQSGVGTGLYGAGVGALLGPQGKKLPAAAIAGAGGAVGGALYGGGLGAGIGYLHDRWDKNHPVEDEEQLASHALLNRLEKTAEENGRQDRKFLTESFLGAGPVGYYAKKNNKLGVKPEDSHTVADAKVGALTGIGTGLYGAGVGALLGSPGKRIPTAALAGAGGAVGGALYGAGAGAGTGYFHDRWDKNHPVEEEQLAHELMHRLEKTAEENGRQDRKFLTESFLGAGPVGYYAKKNNKLGVKPEDSHTVADAKVGALTGIGTGLYGAGVGALLGSPGKRIPTAALAGAGGAVGGALYGAGAGAGTGYFHDRWDKNHPVEEEQLAHELMHRLEKTAEENGRQDRKFLTEYAIGAGPIGYFAKKHNTLGVNPEDSHAVANAKTQGLTGGTGGGLTGAGLGALLATNAGKKKLPMAALGGAAGALGGGAYGALYGGAIGHQHDRWDKQHPVEEEQLASQELMNRLEKSAASVKGALSSLKNFGKKTVDQSKNFANNASGKNYRTTKNNEKKWNDSAKRVHYNQTTALGPVKVGADDVKKAKNDMFKAQAIGAGALAGAAGTAGILNNRDKEEKTASEEVLSGLYKEAASAILNESLPPVRKHVDPMKKIAFSK